MKSVSIIMSTFNGEKYLEEQMKSLLTQTYPVKILIHDDGSTDSTVDIIRKYVGQYANGTTVSLSENSGTNLKYPLCFLDTLIRSEQTDYYAFCDQDDIWMPEKIEYGVQCLEDKDQNKPLLFYSAVNYCDEQMNVRRKSSFTGSDPGINERIQPEKLIYGGGVLGMSMLFNHAMRQCLEKAVKQAEWKTKDELIKKIAASLGEVYYTERPLANYRRHKDAVTAGTNTVSSMKKIMSVVKKSVKNNALLMRDEQIYQFISRNYGMDLDKNQRSIADSFVKRQPWKRAVMPFRYRWKLTDEIGLRLLILTGKR